MKKILIIFVTFFIFSCGGNDKGSESGPNYAGNRPPLKPNPYIELPLGTIIPQGWLEEQLKRMASGMTGQLDKQYSLVLGKRNGWLGGDGDGWERGPYWLDGLIPLAYLLKDDSLLDKARPWVEWSLNNQQENGYFGPIPFRAPPTPEPGIQKDRRQDWWPKMVMLKVLKQYYSATGDARVIELFTQYFKFQLKELADTPLDSWSFWANRRGGDNLMMVYWLYNITGDEFLLALADILHAQTFPYTRVFLNPNCKKQDVLDHLYPYNTGNRYPFDWDLIDCLCLEQLQSFHCVNIAQGIKEPVIYYQQHPDETYIHAVKKAFEDIEKYHGQPQGMYGGDEPLHGNDPTRGVEFCSVVELMFSLENILKITGMTSFADHLEKIAYNALPTQATDDFTSRQYFQSANQVLISRDKHNFFEDDNHGGTDLCYGLLTGYPCCTCNMHQGWPKYTQNLWYATPDRGLAALLYAPCTVKALVGEGKEVMITEETHYPFEESIRFRISVEGEITFPFHLRVPGWCREGIVSFNGKFVAKYKGGQIITVSENWSDGDMVELHLPMHIFTTRWHENSVAVQRGPLVYSLRIEEDWRWIENEDKYGSYFEIHPTSPWNYGLENTAVRNPEEEFRVSRRRITKFPWNIADAPIELKTTAKRIPGWQLYNAKSGPLPHSGPQRHLSNVTSEEITLIPYGCTTLRITEFPVVE